MRTLEAVTEHRLKPLCPIVTVCAFLVGLCHQAHLNGRCQLFTSRFFFHLEMKNFILIASGRRAIWNIIFEISGYSLAFLLLFSVDESVCFTLRAIKIGFELLKWPLDTSSIRTKTCHLSAFYIFYISVTEKFTFSFHMQIAGLSNTSLFHL